MSKLEELIQELCPNGIQYHLIGDICDVLTGGEAPPESIKEKEPQGEYIYPIYSNGLGDNALWGYSKTFRIDKPAVTFSSIGTIGFPTLREAKFTPIIRLKVIYPKDANKLNICFLKYALEIVQFEKQKSSVANVNASMIKNIKIPVPPLPVQEEIVRILDNFTELTTELTTELAARKRQYEYYRDSLLDISNLKPNAVMHVGDLFEIKNGLNKEKSAFGKGTPIVNFADVYNKRYLTKDMVKGLVTLTDSEVERYSVKKGDVFFTRTSETKEDIGMSSTVIDDIPNCTFSGFVLRARPLTDLLLPKFCSYYFSTKKVRDTIVRYASFTTRATTSGPKLSKIPVPIIDIEEQKRIVGILDRFDTLCNDISTGLPAEIEARQKQYEYYRDKLLTFKELK